MCKTSLSGDTKTELLDAARVLLGIKDNDSDDLLSLLIDETIDAVLSYCRIDVLPRQLESFIPQLAARRFTENQNGGIKSITEGERRVEYGDTKSDFLSEYTERLKPFVSRRVKVPSDLHRKGDTKHDKSV